MSDFAAAMPFMMPTTLPELEELIRASEADALRDDPVPDELQPAKNNLDLQAHQEHLIGMINGSELPDAMKAEAVEMVVSIMGAAMSPNVDPELMDQAQALYGEDVKTLVDDFWKLMFEQILEEHADEANDEAIEAAGAKDGEKAQGGASAGGGSANWLVQLAQKMAEIQTKYAELMESASDRMASAVEGEIAFDDTAPEANGKSKASTEEHNQAQRAEFIRAQAEFTAYSRLFSMSSEATSTAIKSIGEGLTSIARKQ